MKRINRIPIFDLKAGMFVTGFDKPEVDYPYYNTVLPDDKLHNTLISLIDLDVKYAYITEDPSIYLLQPVVSNDQNIDSSNQEDALYTSLLTLLGEVLLSGAIGQGINIRSDYDNIVKFIGSALKNEELAVYFNAIRSYDEATYNHSVRVAIYSTLMAIKLEMNEDNINKLVLAALLHDVGKVYISHTILNKPDKLDIHEFFMMQDHPVQSYNILKKDPIFAPETLLAVKYHHERSDTSGYPSALPECEIPLFAKLLAIADVYDAITSRRVYSKGMNIYDAVSFITSKAGKFFNIKLVNFFVKSIGIFTKGSTLLLNTNELALIFEESRNTSFPPKILILTDENSNPLKKPFVFDLNKKDDYGIFIKTVSEIVDIDTVSHNIKANIDI